MSYLENGSTHRSLFRLMPPLHHDADPARSQVLAHIVENTGWSMGRAIAAFNSMRNPRSRVLIFDKTHRVWKGCDWVPSKDDVSIQMVLSDHRALERRVIAMDADLRRAMREIDKLRKQVANLKKSDADDDSSEEESDEDYAARRKAESEELSRKEAEEERIKADQKRVYLKAMKMAEERAAHNPAKQMEENVRLAWS